MKKLYLIPIILFILSACTKEEVKLESSIIGEEAFRYAMPKNGKFVHPKHGEEKWFAYGAVQGVFDNPANGVVQAYKYEDGAFAVTMQLNIRPTLDNQFYEVWLSSEDSESLESIGHLNNYFGDSRHQLNFDSDIDFSDKLRVFVTKENDDSNPAPSADLAAQGLLKPTRR